MLWNISDKYLQKANQNWAMRFAIVCCGCGSEQNGEVFNATKIDEHAKVESTIDSEKETVKK